MVLLRLTGLGLTGLYFAVCSLHGFLAGASFILALHEDRSVSAASVVLALSWLGSGCLAGLWISMILRARSRLDNLMSTRMRPGVPDTDSEVPRK